MSRYAVALHERVLVVTDLEAGIARAPKHARRSVVRGISSKSRYRLIRYLAQITRPDEAVFITLTYRNFSDDYQVWKEHLHGFHMWLVYHYPDLAGFWRLEFQVRGAPHFHLLLWLGDVTELDSFREDCKRAWCRIIQQRSAANLVYGCTVEPVTDWRKSAFYISVYQAKDNQDRDDIQTGREWGIWGKERLGLDPVSTVNLSRKGFLLFRRCIRRSYRAFQRGPQGTAARKKSGYLRALRADQPFTNFMPYGAAAILAAWCNDPANSGDTDPF